MLSAIKFNVKKIAVGIISAAVIATIVAISIKAYGNNGNWDVYKTNISNYVIANMEFATVPDNPANPSTTYSVQKHMNDYNSNINNYSIVNSITNGAAIGVHANETNGEANFAYSLKTFVDGGDTVSGWYNSTYGPILEYEASNTDASMQSRDAFQFSQLLFPEGSNRVYVAGGGQSEYLRDAKAIATLYNDKYPILLDQTNGDDTVNSYASQLNAKNVIFLGGTGGSQGAAIFGAMKGMNNAYDMVRIGGINSAQTARFVKELPQSVYDNPVQPSNNINSYSGITADSSVSASVVAELTNTLKTQGFDAAVKEALSQNLGNDALYAETNVQSGTPALIIGGINGQPTGDDTKDQANEEYVKIYLCNPSAGQLVFQYFQKGFFTTIPGTYSLTVKAFPAEGGTAGDSATGLKPGSKRTLWEKPAAGYQFTGWTVTPNADIDNKNVLTMPAANTVVTANFSKDSKMVNLTIKVYPANAGTVTGGGNQMLKDGKAIFSNITETPSTTAPTKSHWIFDHWGVIKGDNVAPDGSNNVTITKDTILVAYYILKNDDTTPTFGDESSILTVSGSVDKPVAKEGQLVTFTINTSSNDFRYPITDSRGWQDGGTPSYLNYNQGEFVGILWGQGEESHDFGHWERDDGDSYWVSHWKYRQDYLGTIYRSPIPYFSAQRLQLTFPDEISYSTGQGLNEALTDNLNTSPLVPYMEWYIQSTPTFSPRYSDGQIWKYNTEKIEFYVPLTTPITIRDDGTRIRDPYVIKIHAIETNGYITADTTIQLDVQGNIYKGIYTTPIG